MKKLFILTFSLVLTGCSGASISPLPNETEQPSQQSESFTQPSKTPVKPATLTVQVAKFHHPNLDLHPIRLTTNGSLTSATLSGVTSAAANTAKLIKISDKEWVFKGRLDFSKEYMLRTTVKNTEGVSSSKRVRIKTIKPAGWVSPTIYPVDNDVVGIGMPITVDFKQSVKNRSEIEKLLKVTTSPATTGSWGWMQNDTQVVWRPHAFWKPGTKVSVSVPVKDAYFGSDVYGRRSVTTKFQVGRSLVMKVEDSKKSLTVIEKGKVIKSFPVSLGKPGKRTSSGYNIVYGKANPERMVGTDYNQLVNWAQRYNTTGEYLHSAPWSVSDQGVRNVSHGCVNIGPKNAKWLYKKTLMGDVVYITGTGRRAETWDGMGAIWNYPVKEWKKLSSL